jgi:hypothetical protein
MMAFLLKLDSDGTSFRTNRLRGFLLLILALSTRTCGCVPSRRIHAAPYGGEFDSRGRDLSPLYIRPYGPMIILSTDSRMLTKRDPGGSAGGKNRERWRTMGRTSGPASRYAKGRRAE